MVLVFTRIVGWGEQKAFFLFCVSSPFSRLWVIVFLFVLLCIGLCVVESKVTLAWAHLQDFWRGEQAKESWPVWVGAPVEGCVDAACDGPGG